MRFDPEGVFSWRIVASTGNDGGVEIEIKRRKVGASCSHWNDEIRTRERASGRIQVSERQKKEWINEWMGDGRARGSLKIVRAREFRERLWMRINLRSGPGVYSPVRHETAKQWRSYIFVPFASLSADLYIEKLAFEVAPERAAVNFCPSVAGGAAFLTTELRVHC